MGSPRAVCLDPSAGSADRKNRFGSFSNLISQAHWTLIKK